MDLQTKALIVLELWLLSLTVKAVAVSSESCVVSSDQQACTAPDVNYVTRVKRAANNSSLPESSHP